MSASTTPASRNPVAMLEPVPRLGWVEEPSPLTPLPELASRLGFRSLLIKRDDLLPALYGGSKVRKLDYLLAAEPWRQARAWHGIGALGSGLLTALSAAARQQGKALTVHVFDEEIDAHVLDNLAATVSVAAEVRHYRSRAELGLKNPSLFRKLSLGDAAVVPPGATHPAGIVGAVRGGLELGAQIEAGLLEPPDVIVTALGSAGTAVGLSIGCAMVGIRPTIAAVSAIERAFVSPKSLAKLTEDTKALLTKHGVGGVSSLTPAPIQLDFSALGAGYGRPSFESVAAVSEAERFGLSLESIYSGKAFAALLAAKDLWRGKRVLFWNTVRGARPRVSANWQSRLPPALALQTAAL